MKDTIEKLDILEEAKQQIKIDEGLVLHPYKDSVDVTTIGYGRNLEENGISIDEAEHMFQNDYKQAVRDAERYLGMAWNTLNAPRQGVIINMAFNLGYSRLNGLGSLRDALFVRDYELAADKMEGYLWYKQVKDRAVRLVKIMREGK